MVEGTSTTFSSWIFYKLLLFGETILILLLTDRTKFAVESGEAQLSR